MELRDCVPDDLPAVRALLREIGWEERYIQGQAGSLLKLQRDPHGQALVAVVERELAGFVTVLFAPWNGLAQLHGLAVAPRFQRRGVAAALVAAAEGFARQQGGRGVFVDTPVNNQVARAFYRAQGYAEAYVMPEYYAAGLDGVTFIKFFRPA